MCVILLFRLIILLVLFSIYSKDLNFSRLNFGPTIYSGHPLELKPLLVCKKLVVYFGNRPIVVLPNTINVSALFLLLIIKSEFLHELFAFTLVVL